MDSNNSTLLNNFEKKMITTYYCKYCREERGKALRFPTENGPWISVSKQSYEQLEPTFTAGEKKRWAEVKHLDPKKKICRVCYTNKEEKDLIIVKSPNYLAILSEKLKERERKERADKKNKEKLKTEVEEIDYEHERLVEEGWIGPITRSCIDPTCVSKTAYVKIRPPLSDDEPPMITYRCCTCSKTNLDYKQ